MTRKNGKSSGFTTESGFGDGAPSPDMVDDQTSRGVVTPPAIPLPAHASPMAMIPQMPVHAGDPTFPVAPTMPHAAVSMAPPMDVERQAPPLGPAAPLPIPVPASPYVEALGQGHQLQAMQAEISRMMRHIQELEMDNDRLEETTRQALTRPAASERVVEKAPPATEYKLHYAGYRLEQQPGMPARYVLDVMHDNKHYCGLLNRRNAAGAEEPYVFVGTHEDPWPHAMITRRLGDYLIANDARRDPDTGRPLEVRYKWSQAALDAFAREDHAAALAKAEAAQAEAAVA